MPLDLDVVVEAGPALLPFGVDVDRIKGTSPADVINDRLKGQLRFLLVAA